MTEQYYPELDETLFSAELPNGLRILVLPRAGFSRKTAYLMADFGSIHTDFLLDGQRQHVPDGTAHYLEHKMFELPDGRDVSAEFAALGASVNAFTSYDITAYYFSCTDRFYENLHLLLEFVTVPWFPAESVERERGIIDQEIAMNLDAPDSVIYDRMTQAMYPSHPVRIPILGSSESIREITPRVLELCHRAFCTPANLVLCVVGDVDPRQVEEAVRQQLPEERLPAGEKCRDWEENMVSPRHSTECRMEVAMPTFLLGFKCEPLPAGEAALRGELAADLAVEALMGESSGLYLQMYEEGLIDSSFGGGYETIDGCAMLSCSGDSDDPAAVRSRILSGARELVRTGLTEEAMLRLKRSALGRRIRGMDSFDGTCFRLGACLLAGFDYLRFPEVLRSIRWEEMREFLDRVIREERSCLSVIYPLEEEA